MSKGKNQNKSKLSDADKLIAEWEEKLSIAEVNKNKQEILSIKKVLDFYKRKKEGKAPLQ